MDIAADRLEELQCDAEKAYKLRKDAEIERDSLRDSMALDMLELTQQRDEACAEAERLNEQRDSAYEQVKHWAAETERLKQERDLWQQIQRDEATVKQQLTVRPEPSRLEIAAMLVASRFSSTLYVTEVKGTWINYALQGADALIAAAKEGK